MPNYNSIEGNVLFPTIDGYDMHKAGDMALETLGVRPHEEEMIFF